jgi:inner membrane protein YidH
MPMNSETPRSPASQPKASVSDYQRGSEHLAAERTFLAWIRTSISVISLGFVVSKFGVWLREISESLNPGGADVHKTSASLPMGIAMMAIGGVLALLALWHYHVVNVSIERGQVRPNRAMIVTVALAVAFLSVLIILYLLLTTENR